VVHTLYMTTIQPLDNRFAETFNRFATGDDTTLAERFDSAIRNLINVAHGKKIVAIKIFRDFAVVFGAEIGLREAKETIDSMTERIIIETMRDLLAFRVGSPRWIELDAKLSALYPDRVKAQPKTDDDA
jgi:hypothetical protein